MCCHITFKKELDRKRCVATSDFSMHFYSQFRSLEVLAKRVKENTMFFLVQYRASSFLVIISGKEHEKNQYLFTFSTYSNGPHLLNKLN